MKRKFINIELNRLEFLDQRFYLVGDTDNPTYLPSVTTILDVYPKGPAFDQWLKDTGAQAGIIAQRAADSGSRVHAGIERLIKGEEIVWDDKEFNMEEWQALLKYVDFNERFKPNVLAAESVVYNLCMGYAGQVDIVCEIDGVRWLLDNKFGNAIYKTYWFQLVAYKEAWEEMHPDLAIDKVGILWLKAHTRTEGKKGTMQGKGWQIVEPPDTHERLWGIFRKTLEIYKYENPNDAPKNVILPFKVKL